MIDIVLMKLCSLVYQTEQTPLEGLIERLKQLKDEAEGDYSEEENRRRFDAVESQTAECKQHSLSFSNSLANKRQGQLRSLTSLNLFSCDKA